jgi:hypothetical protein
LVFEQFREYGIKLKAKCDLWNYEQEQAFEALKQALPTTPVLTLPNAHDKFILDTDASDTAIRIQLL